MINLKEVLDDIVTFAKALENFTSFPGNVKEYEGEYETDDWTEKHPSCLIEISGMIPKVKDASKDLAASRIEFIVFIGAKTNTNKHPLQISGEFMSEMEGQEFVYDDGRLYAHLISMNLFGRRNQLKIYALRFELIQ